MLPFVLSLPKGRQKRGFGYPLDDAEQRKCVTRILYFVFSLYERKTKYR
jgi:hypothetical protein